jgi:tetraprenyl-beta-curcumene synthase
LRRIALDTLAEEHGNLEGAASFAAFLPRRQRVCAVRTLVAFQAIFDYADSLAEQPARSRVANGRALHEALIVALTPGQQHPDYYAHCAQSDDGGYLRDLVDRCRCAFAALPSHAVVQLPTCRAVRRMIEYQTLIHGESGPALLGSWARAETPPGSGLHWWETAAGGASSLVAFALIAAAARPSLSEGEVAALDEAYFPWIGSLHVLLDSLIDWPEDSKAGHHSLVAHYGSPAETAARMDAIAGVALRSTQALPNARQHELFLAAMVGFYLAKPSARLPHAAEAAGCIIATLGEVARPVLWVHQARQAAARVREGSRT